MIAVITNNPEIYKVYLFQNSLSEKNAKMICRKSDLDDTVYKEIVDLDPQENVTQWVRDRIKTK